jgi:hypothetical protein
MCRTYDVLIDKVITNSDTAVGCSGMFRVVYT